jgi:hypothetical protein
MQRIIVLLLTICLSFLASSQILKGKISNKSGEPIPYATIYIHEITSGIVADERGEFQTKVKSGSYTCEIRSIGFQSQTKTIQVTSSGVVLNVSLTEKPVLLNELTVIPSKDNPADRVMRHAISMAPFHLYQVSGYTSENYLKGSAKIEKIPTLMKMMMNDQKMKALIGKLLVMESKNEITFQSPSKYIQKVIAYKSSIPKEMEPNGGFRISPSNIYETNFMGKISPLSIHAFQYYRFKLEDVFSNGSYQVNKIKVLPKLKNEKLFSGYLYILEDNWSVFSIDLSFSEMGTTTRIKRNYQEVKPAVFMPITYETYTDIGTMGVKGYARFYSSVKYKKIKINESVKSTQIQTGTPTVKPVTSKKQQKKIDMIDKLSSKDKLTTVEAIRLAHLLTAVTEPKEIRDRKESIEIKDSDMVKMDIDSLASKRDSTFWQDIRNVPLLPEEAQSFKQKETLPVSKNINTTGNSISISLGNSNTSTSWLMGGNIPLGKTTHLFYEGLLRGALKEYNFVDGFWLGQKLTFSISTNKTNSLLISPSVYYATARRSAVWNVNSLYNYAPLADGRIRLAIGNTSEDIQKENGTSRFINSISSLFFGDNVIRFYQKKYIMLENQIDIANGLKFTSGAGFEYRHLLTNKTGYHIFGDTPVPNFPNQAYSDLFPTNTATTGWMKLEYTPFYRYRLKDGKKEYVSSEYPTFAVDYKKAIPLFNQTEQSSYDKIEISMHQSLTVSEFDKLNYKVSVGDYLTKQKLYTPDFNYFATSPLLISTRSFDDSFNLLENYTSNTNRWLEAQIKWTSDYLVLKRIGFMQHYLFNEALQIHTFWNMQKEKPYIETGYSIGFNNLGRIGIFSAFDGFNYKSTGIKISIPLFSIQAKK